MFAQNPLNVVDNPIWSVYTFDVGTQLSLHYTHFLFAACYICIEASKTFTHTQRDTQRWTVKPAYCLIMTCIFRVYLIGEAGHGDKPYYTSDNSKTPNNSKNKIASSSDYIYPINISALVLRYCSLDCTTHTLRPSIYTPAADGDKMYLSTPHRTTSYLCHTTSEYAQPIVMLTSINSIELQNIMSFIRLYR